MNLLKDENVISEQWIITHGNQALLSMLTNQRLIIECDNEHEVFELKDINKARLEIVTRQDKPKLEYLIFGALLIAMTGFILSAIIYSLDQTDVYLFSFLITLLGILSLLNYTRNEASVYLVIDRIGGARFYQVVNTVALNIYVDHINQSLNFIHSKNIL